MSGRAAAGAVVLKSMTAPFFVAAVAMIMFPPYPPIPQRAGTATHEVSAAATAASTAFPPAVRIFSPAAAPASSPMIAPAPAVGRASLEAANIFGAREPTRTAWPVRASISRREILVLIAREIYPVSLEDFK